MPAVKVRDIRCPCCDEFLSRLDLDGGSRIAESVPLKDDEHGKYSICSNCKRKIRMEQPSPDVWIPARQQDCS